jgi:hypothetical protein
MTDNQETQPESPKFDFDAYPPDALIHDRRSSPDRRDATDPAQAPGERRARKERRRRIDPTTFEKQYTDDELEFMNAMQAFKMRTGRPFPTHREVLAVAVRLGYRRAMLIPEDEAN